MNQFSRAEEQEVMGTAVAASAGHAAICGDLARNDVSSILAAQCEYLRSLRSDLASNDASSLDSLRRDLATRRERERQVTAQLAAAQRESAAMRAENEDLRLKLERQAKAHAWDMRKRNEATATASAAAASAVESLEARNQAQLSKQAAQLQKQEAELKAAHAKIRALRHRLDDHALQQSQDALISRCILPAGQHTQLEGEVANEPPSSEAPAQEEAQPVADAKDALESQQEAFIARVLGY